MSATLAGNALPKSGWRWRERSILPGFAPTFTITLVWLGIIVIGPLGVMLWFTAGLGFSGFWHIITIPRVLGDLRVSLSTAFAASLVNAGFGLLVAWVLVRYQFPGRRIADALVDLPFALPTAVAGIALSTLYAPNGWIGALLAPFGIQIAFSPAGIVVAMMFISLPFIVRTVQPVIEDLEAEQEEAAATDGRHAGADISAASSCPRFCPRCSPASRWPSRACLGEYGSIIFIAGNKPMISEIVPVLIVSPARSVRLSGRHRHRHADASGVLCAAAGDQPAASLGEAPPWRLTRNRCSLGDRYGRADLSLAFVCWRCSWLLPLIIVFSEALSAGIGTISPRHRRSRCDFRDLDDADHRRHRRAGEL